MIPRFHCPVPIAAGRAFALPPQAAHHAQRVLRLRAGDEVVLFDGTGGEWPGRLLDASRAGQELQVMPADRCDLERESPLALTLAQALPAADKMDWVVQKAVELGAAAIQPLAARRSVVRLAGERAEKRMLHWRQVIISACEQCGRNRVPALSTLFDLPQYLAQPAAENETRLLLSPHQGLRLSLLPRPKAGVTLLVGPEGGFTDEEEQAALRAGFTAVALGPRILRTETAGVAAIAAIMALWGDF